MKRKAFSTVLIAIVLMIALACTALAVAHQLGLLDALLHYHPETSGDASALIQSGIAQEGGETESALFTVRDAAYVGNMVRFTVAVTPKNDNDIAMFEGAMYNEQTLAEARAQGQTIVGADCWADLSHVSGTSFGETREGNAVLLDYAYSLENGHAPETLPITLQCCVYDPDHVGQPLEAAVPLTFTLSRTPAPDAVDLTVDIDLGFARITRIELRHSALELHSVITAEVKAAPDLPSFYLLDAEGYPLESGSEGGSQYMPEQGNLIRADAAWAAPPEMPQVLRIWAYRLRTVGEDNWLIEVDLQTGETACYPAMPYNAMTDHPQILPDKS